MHAIVYDFFFIKQTSCLIQNNLMHAMYILPSSLNRNFEVKKIEVANIIVTSYYVLQKQKNGTSNKVKMIVMRRDNFSVKSNFQNWYYLLPDWLNQNEHLISMLQWTTHVLLTCIVDSLLYPIQLGAL
jgi:hypothetical protein